MNQVVVNLIVGASLILTFLLFSNPNKNNIAANKWLSAFVLCFFFLNIDEFFIYNKIDVKHLYINQFFIFSFYFICPVFYFTVVYFVNPTRKWKNIDYLHFVIGLSYFFIYKNIFTFSNNRLVLANEENQNWLNTANVIYLYVVLPIQIFTYVGYSFYLIQKHQKNIKKFSSNTSEINLSWLQKILYCNIFLASIFLLDMIFKCIEFVNLCYFIGLFYIGFNALKQKEIFPFTDENKLDIQNSVYEVDNNIIEKKKLLTDIQLNETKAKLIKWLENEKPFLNSEISLVQLATSLTVKPHVLSYVINEGFNENFNQLINRYRIEEAKKLILDSKYDNLSILGIGFEVGFNSKSSFNHTFKKNTGLTPNEFKKANLKTDFLGTEL